MFGFLKKKKNRKFGEIAVQKGLTTERNILEALNAQREYLGKHHIQKKLGAILIENGLLSPNDVKSILDEQRGHAGTMAWFSALSGLSR